MGEAENGVRASDGTERRSLLERALRNIGAGVIEAHTDGRDVVLEPPTLAVLGFESDDVAKDDVAGWLRSRVHPDDIADAQADAQELIRGQATRMERELRFLDGRDTYRWLVVTGSIRDGRLECVFQDVTARRAEFARSEERFRALFENAPFMIDSFTADGRCLLWNQACVDNLGYTREEIDAAEDPLALFYPDPNTRRGVLESVRSGEGVFREYTVQTRSGPRFQRWANFVLPGGDPIGVGYDVTAERQAVERLHHAQRLASIGTLAAGVAHEINNPATYLLTNTEMSMAALRRALGRQRDPDLQKVLEMLGDNILGVRRIQSIVRELGSFSRVDSSVAVELDINEVVGEAVRFAGNQVRHRAALDVELGDVPAIVGRPKQLVQALVNLLVNASLAIDEGQADQQRVSVTSSFDPDAGQIRVAVADSGSGIAPEIIPRLFEPFFTTRAGKSGTGLGLALAFETVQDHGGTIEVETEVGRGSVFSIVLPRDTGMVASAAPAAEDAVAEARPPAASDASSGQPLRVLLIDDEPLVRESLLRVLDVRYEGVAVSGARDALEMLRQGERFDVIVCDVMMDDIDGAELYARLQAEMPSLVQRVVFLTGGAITDRARRFTDSVDAPLLVKPVGVHDLFEAVDAAAARAARG